MSDEIITDLSGWTREIDDQEKIKDALLSPAVFVKPYSNASG